MSALVDTCRECEGEFIHEDELNGELCWACIDKKSTLTSLELACHTYLSTLPFVLFADFDISRPDRRTAAARWLAEQVHAVREVMGQ